MIFKDYCIVVMGDTEGALEEIVNISDNNPKLVNAKGILICTFNSIADAKELEDYFTSLGRSFFLFEVGAKNSGYNIKNKEIHNGLFLDIESNQSKNIDKTKDFLTEVNFNYPHPLSNEVDKILKNSINNNTGQTKDTNNEIDLNLESTHIDLKVTPNKFYYENLSDKEKDDIINTIIDKGYNNLTDFDKEVLKILSK
jgi:hypothetical protein